MSNPEFDKGWKWGFIIGAMFVVFYFSHGHQVWQWIFGPPEVPAAYRSWEVDDSMYQVKLPEERQLANVSLTSEHVADCENYFVLYGEVRADCQDWKEYADHCGHWRSIYASQPFSNRFKACFRKMVIEDFRI